MSGPDCCGRAGGPWCRGSSVAGRTATAKPAGAPMERKVLARKSLVANIWLATGKKVYRAITRGLFNFTDREGGGRRLVNDAPVLAHLIRKNPEVRDTAIVAFADRRSGVGL